MQTAIAIAAVLILPVSARSADEGLRRVVFIGDSLTANTFVAAKDQYPTVAARWVGDVLVQNLGVPGGKMTNPPGRWPGWGAYPDVVTALSGLFPPRAVVLLIGTNDWRVGQTAAQVETTYRQFLSVVPTPVRVICVTPPWRADQGERNAVGETLDDVRAAIARACMVRGLVVRGENAIPHEPRLYVDVVHPNAMGNRYLARAVAQALRKVL